MSGKTLIRSLKLMMRKMRNKKSMVVTILLATEYKGRNENEMKLKKPTRKNKSKTSINKLPTNEYSSPDLTT